MFKHVRNNTELLASKLLASKLLASKLLASKLLASKLLASKRFREQFRDVVALSLYHLNAVPTAGVR